MPRTVEPRRTSPQQRESTVAPPSRRGAHMLASLGSGAVLGPALFAAGVWIVGTITGHNWSLDVYLIAAVLGVGIGMGLVTYMSLAWQPDDDDVAAGLRGRRGRADAPFEGAEAADEARAPHPPGGIR